MYINLEHQKIVCRAIVENFFSVAYFECVFALVINIAFTPFESGDRLAIWAQKYMLSTFHRPIVQDATYIYMLCCSTSPLGVTYFLFDTNSGAMYMQIHSHEWYILSTLWILPRKE